MATYWEKLKDPRWQRKRLEILQRANFACEVCGDKNSTLHVHHGYYERAYDPWDYSSETLHCLCESCHEMVQEQIRDLHFELAKIHPVDYTDVMAALLKIRNDSGGSESAVS